MNKSIDILDELIKQQPNKKFQRHTKLLADFTNGYAEGWFFCVPIFFFEALDIKFTYRIKDKRKKKLWTQGSTFKFSTGDMIWNYAYPYCKNFVSGIIKPKIGVQVQSAEPCLPKTKHRSRYSGKVNFILFTESNDQYTSFIWKVAGHYSGSQDDFVEFLIKGSSQSFDPNLNLEGFN